MLYRLFIADPQKTQGRRLYLASPRTEAQVADLRRSYAFVRAIPILWGDRQDFEPTESLIQSRRNRS